MKKWIVVVGILVVLGAGVYFAVGLSGQGGVIPTAAPAAAPGPPPVRAANQVVAEAKVTPIKMSTIGFSGGGTVAEVAVSAGDRVSAGQLLARLDSARPAAAVAQAEAGLARAQAGLDALKAGPRSQEVEAARATLAAAGAQLNRVLQSALPEEIAAAEASLDYARASLEKAQEGAGADKVASAKAALARLKNGPTPEELEGAAIAVEQAKLALWGIQTERDGICGNPAAPAFQCDAGSARAAAAEAAVAAAQNNVDKLRASPRPEDLAAAQALLDELLSEPGPSTLASAEAQVQQANSSLAKLKTPARPAEIAAAEAEVRRARAQLDLTEAGSRPETIAGAEADVAAAMAALQQAKAALAETELRAGFAGTVASLNLRPGEYVAPGAAGVSLADLSEWQIETTDLTELGVVRVQEGAPVTITFDALPDLELQGKVTRIKALGEKSQGDIIYTVQIKPDRHEPRLYWNMTASVTIQAK